MEALIVAFTTGALGSVGHCIGMCGGFSLAIAAAGRECEDGASWKAQLGYHLGRTATYTFLGLFFGTLGSVGRFSGTIGPWIHTTVAVLAGLVMIYAGLAVLGVFSERAGPTAMLPERLFAGAMRPAGKRALPYGLHAGLVLGLLPCGLLLAAEAQAAATQSPVMGALVMFAFAQGTVPALALGTSVLERLSLSMRQRVHGLAGVVLILWGVWSLARPVFMHFHQHEGAHDHHQHHEMSLLTPSSAEDAACITPPEAPAQSSALAD